jgi:hypothetical protein
MTALIQEFQLMSISLAPVNQPYTFRTISLKQRETLFLLFFPPETYLFELIYRCYG